MISRTLDSRLPLVVYNPSGVFSAEYMESVYEAGGLPVFDTEFFKPEQAINRIQELGKKDILFGVRINFLDSELISFLNDNYIPNLTSIVLAYNKKTDIRADAVAMPEYKLIIEVLHVDLLEEIAPLCPSAIIVRGNEAPGKVAKFTSYILLQWYIENSIYPVIVHGGVGQYTGAGMFAAGASAVVLDDQLYLTDESPLAPNFKEAIAKIEEKDSIQIGQSLGRQYRFFTKLSTKIVKELAEKESLMLDDPDADDKLYAEINNHIAHVDDANASVVQSLFYLGQDAGFARFLTKKSKRLKDVIEELFTGYGRILADVDSYDPMIIGSPLAKEHDTKYPIIQGPMANITDNADFSAAVAEHGALPFLAMGSLPPAVAKDMLEKGMQKSRVLGAGMIGIAALNKTIDDHMQLIKDLKVPFALFAGGIPGQVKELEAAGTKAYLHTPAASMLENAVNNGVTRFIFEGREAGGHVGSLTSMVLWEASIQKFVNMFPDKIDGTALVFAGGIGCRTGSHFISGMTSFLAKQGARIGIQVGTTYLFSQEIVQSGAIKPFYQKLMQDMNETVVTGETLGLSTRSLPTPFSKNKIINEHKRIKDGLPLQERKMAFEKENLGSLLIGAKGVCIDLSDLNNVKFNPVCEEDTFTLGNFMAGDALVFDDSALTVEEIHEELVCEKEELFRNLDRLEVVTDASNEVNDEIAIVGMGAIYPEANNYDEFWQNILDKKYFIKELSNDRVDQELYYNEDRKVPDKTYTKIAATVDQFVFDHKKYGYSKKEAAQISRAQQFVLEASYMAIEDAGYLAEGKCLPKERTSVIIGSCLGNELSHSLVLKYYMPEIKHYLEQIDEYKSLSDEEKSKVIEALKKKMSYGVEGEHPDGTALNVEASRVAKHFGLEGQCFIVDAACATSFSALDSGVKDLLSGEKDCVITGGINTNMMPEPFIGFCKMGALSADGSYPFDERANGFVMGEGAGVVVLKRMKDAIRDGDRIHAVLKTVGSSSDGKGRFIAAPSADGQEYSLHRCYENAKAELTPEDIGFIEAHGTSTLAGDKTEVITLKRVYNGSKPIGLSSVKSQIGHLLGGAGAAGLIKAVLAVEKKILPPNGQFEKLSPNCSLEGSPFYIVENAQEWKEVDRTRKAAVSSYGFGGINYHCIVEEFSDKYKVLPRKIFADLNYDFNDDRIVITGAGCIAPGAKNIDEFWKVLSEGKNHLVDLPENNFHIDCYADETGDYYLPKSKVGVVDNYKFNNVKFRIPPQSAKHVDRSQLFALDIAGQALESSGLVNKLDKGNNIAVIVGTMSGTMNSENIMRSRVPFISRIIEESGVSNAPAISGKTAELLNQRYATTTEDTIPGLLSNIVSGRICNFWGCNGANFTVDSSDASAAVAMGLAIKGLKSGSYEFALTGGIDTNLIPTVFKVYNELGLLTDEDTALFDARAKGVNLGEGGALFALTKYSTAKKNGMKILAEINGLNLKVNAESGLYKPSEETFATVIDDAYINSHVSKRQVRHLDVFGSANVLFDQVEHQALSRSFSGKKIPYGNSKPQIGYMRSANPAIVLAKMLLMEQKKSLLPFVSYNAETSVTKMASPLKAIETAQVLDSHNNVYAANIYAHGGSHAHLIMSTFPDWLLSAKSKGSTAAPVSSSLPGSVPQVLSSVAILCSGQGAQRSGMMSEIYASYPAATKLIDKADVQFKAARGYSIKDLMFNDPEAKLNETENTQPAVFIASAAIFDVMKEKGLKADLFVGHSLGEFTALYCSGAVSFDDTLRLVIKRSELMRDAAKAEKGSIMVVFADAEASAGHISASGLKDIWVANKNSPAQTAVSGRDDAIDKFCDYLKSKSVTFTKLKLSGAFHTPLFNSASEALAKELASVKIEVQNAVKIVSNVTAQPYPADEAAIKDLLKRQMVSPVEFVQSIENLKKAGIATLIEAGPGRLLCNLVAKMGVSFTDVIASVDPKKGEAVSAATALEKVSTLFAGLRPSVAAHQTKVPAQAAPVAPSAASYSFSSDDTGFESFLKNNDAQLKDLLYQEYIKARKDEAFKAIETRGIYTGKVVIPGVSVGLPGLSNKVFNETNFDKVLRGTNLIDSVSEAKQNLVIDKNITRIFKEANGNARYVEINSTEDVMHLAGQLGYFDLTTEYGFKYEYDTTYALAIAAGLEALKDAHIPLILSHKTTSTGSLLPDRIMLPNDMQNSTGVIFTSIFPGFETLIEEITNYHYEKFVRAPYKEFESLYYFLMEKVGDTEVKDKVTEWFFNRKKEVKEGHYTFDRNLLVQILALGSAHFAQFIGAKGPNTHLDAACASTTQAVAVAEDWIRMGRCHRVIIIGGENATSDVMNQWIGSGFLALGAATVKKSVEEGAKPFDETRNGMIVGSGATGIVVERADVVEARGLVGQAEVLGTYMGNSAFHVSKIDVNHLTEEMVAFFDKIDVMYGLNRSEYARKMVFMSHETYTPARGGSADAEVSALTHTFGNDVNKITVTNTKGYTGHTLGAGIEDAVMVKALVKGTVPPVANLTKIPENFKSLKFSKGEQGDFQYGFHLGAGFGSHFAFLFIKRQQENSVTNNPEYSKWLQSVTGIENPTTELKNNILVAESVPGLFNGNGSGNGTNGNTEAVAVQPAQSVAAVSTAPPAAVDTSAVITKIKAIIADQTGYDTEMLDIDLDLEADLGIDTVKQVEIFGKISDSYSLAVPEDLKLSDLNTIAKLGEYIAAQTGAVQSGSAPVATASAPDSGAVMGKIKAIIADQTGYDTEMLEENLDLEADLGIDTVKQVEIFGKISESYSLAVPEDLQLSDLNTIQKLAEYIAGKAGITGSPAASIAAPVGAGVDKSAVLGKIKAIIAEQTGYETDMLEENLDLEADLGIDTVKQVEIFGKISESYSLAVPEDLQLSDLNTIDKLAGYIAERAGSAGTASAAGSSAAAPAGGGVDKGAVTAAIKGIIAEQTGYETEMLEDNLDLEADLGIDTVKQVEIFGKISDNYSLAVPEDLQLSDLNTIDKLAAYIAERAGSATSAPVAAAAPAAATAPTTVAAESVSAASESGIKRFSITVEKRPLKDKGSEIFKDKKFLVIKDSHGFADDFIEVISNGGGTAITAGANETCTYQLDTKSYESLEKSVEALAKAETGINGVFHFGALDAFFAKKISDSDINLAVKSQFILAQKYFDDLNKEGAIIAALSFNSVVFAYSDSENRIEPLLAGVAGLYKTLNKEIPAARVKVVDFDLKDPKKSRKSVIESFTSEVASSNREVEVGYRAGKRYGVRLVDIAPVKGEAIVKNGDRFLVTGGARGITFNILMSLVKEFKTDLVILGRSDISIVDQKFLAPSVTEKTIFDDLKVSMAGSKPLEIKKAASKIMTLVETVRNIEDLKKLGVEVDYHSCDVTNRKRVKEIVSGYDRIDGVLHAAGLEVSQFLTKMDAWSFNSVFDVKVNGLRNLLEAMKDRPYRYMMTFSSVTARFGNEGQVNYTAANDLIGKMLQREQQLHPDRSYKVYDWTAWEGAGMATKETVKKVLEARGLEFVPLDFGVKCFIDDLYYGERLEVLVSGMDHSFDPDNILPQPGSDGVDYFLDREVESKDGFKKFERLLTAERDLFLFDHEKDGVPLFLGATGLETMAEASTRVGEGSLIGMANYQIPYGIKLLKNRPKALDVTAEKKGDSVLAQITSVFRNPAGKMMGDPKLHYQAEFIFGKSLEDKTISVPEFKPAVVSGGFQELIYHPKRLFMHGLFKTVEELLSFEEERMITRVCNSSDRAFFAGVQDPEFTTDPVLVDAMFQTGGMLDVMTTEKIILPYMMKEMKFYRQPEKNVPYLCITEKTAATADINTYNLTLCDMKGLVYLEIINFEMIQVGDVEPGMSIKDKITRS